jgi:chromosomal replication initiator protein
MGLMTEVEFSALWQEALNQLKTALQEKGKAQDFSLWFEPLAFASFDDSSVSVLVRSNFVRDQLLEYGYARMLQSCLGRLVGHDITIKFQIETRSAAPRGAKKAPSDEKTAKPGPEPRKKHPQLREEYTFESFVSGEGSAFPYNAALGVAKNPGKAYNPLFLYGGNGLGKTHLMQAVGNSIYQNFGGKIIYTNAENFTNEFTTALGTNSITRFTSKYRNADVLLLDDIHFIQEKRGVQEQLFYTFEALFNANKQLFFVCDRPISELKGVEERLVTRFGRGLTVDILPPNYETRVAIIEKKLSIIKNSLPKDVIDFIAKNIQTNVRDIEASLTKLFAYADLIQKDITIEIAQEQLRDTINSPRAGNISVELIQKIVANYFNISFSDIRGKKRSSSVALARQIAMFLSRRLTEYSFTDIGNEFGGKDHTTVMHSYDKIEKLLTYDPKIISTIPELERMIKEKKS